MKTREVHHRFLFFLLVFLLLLLAFFASGTHNNDPPRQKPLIEAVHKVAYRFTQPQPPKDPPGDVMFGEECGKLGPTNHFLDCMGKEEYGYCMEGYRCRQTGLRLGKRCLCW